MLVSSGEKTGLRFSPPLLVSLRCWPVLVSQTQMSRATGEMWCLRKAFS